ncbi:hypothetical protein KIN20_026349 [Parelaphostrongylus tenuis]|uniref:Uncharacterized protein n=1 Tax=Parelaphostrongylus tenuis TaxID=148309 RepID=A0AAD5QXX6_PARTN|nr:hypothetical protein KIN20_026348 [Parelaphostrongylus tenuis]KAJ1365884.1 hypothetical protein KIN20_026349 [Parelaphostrongylus tenuis]
MTQRHPRYPYVDSVGLRALRIRAAVGGCGGCDVGDDDDDDGRSEGQGVQSQRGP